MILPIHQASNMQRSTRADDTGQGPELLDRAIAIWRKAQVLFLGCSWQGEPKATAIAEQIAESHPEYAPALADLLLDPSQLVAAYALQTLELMDSPVLQNIPPEVLQRRSMVTMTTRGIQTSTNLGSLARHAQLRARERAGIPPASPSPEAREIGLSAET